MVERVTLDAKEAAIYLGISRWLLYELVKRKQIFPIKAGGRLLFRQSGLDNWMEQQESGRGGSSNESCKLSRAK